MRRVAAACAVALLAGLATPAAAEPAGHVLTVRGTPNASAEVTFTTRVRLSTNAHSASPPEIAGEGTYAGAYVAPVRGDGPAEGALLLPGLPMLTGISIPLGAQGWLPPGRYRVHLLGDAATTVRLHAEGLRHDVAVRTTTPSHVVAAFVHRAVAGVVDAPVDRTVVPLTVRPATLIVLASSHEATGFYGRREVCVRMRDPGLSPCLDGNAGKGGYYSVIPVQWGLAGAAVYPPGKLPTGEIEAEFLDYTVGVPKELHAFSMTLN